MRTKTSPARHGRTSVGRDGSWQMKIMPSNLGSVVYFDAISCWRGTQDQIAPPSAKSSSVRLSMLASITTGTFQPGERFEIPENPWDLPLRDGNMVGLTNITWAGVAASRVSQLAHGVRRFLLFSPADAARLACMWAYQRSSSHAVLRDGASAMRIAHVGG